MVSTEDLHSSSSTENKIKTLIARMNKQKHDACDDIECLKKLTKEHLIEKLQTLHAHNVQLKNIISKSSNGKKIRRVQKPFDFEKCSYRHILLQFLYLGWNYQGYAVQEDTVNTIENVLFDALIKTCLIKERAGANYHRCGRTDKGVSSFGQVISIDVRSKLTRENEHELDRELDYCKMLNNVLPNDVRCVAWSPANESFSARFDCKGRTYKYFFPLGNLSVEKMLTASTHLIGTHDYRNFCKMDVGNGVVEFVRSITSIDIIQCGEDSTANECTMYVAIIKARAFLWHQIRCIMGILFLIGENKEHPDIVRELLNVEENPRKPDYNMASEIPLNLYVCEYDDSIKWFYKYDVLHDVIQRLKVDWVFGSIKSTMIRSMIGDLELTANTSCSKPSGDYKSSSTCLIQGVKSKVYIPLMQRQRCDSLEDRIKHFAKKSRIQEEVE